MSMRSLLPSLWGHPDEKDPFRSLQTEIDRVFNDFNRGMRLPGLTENATGARLAPRIDVSETNGTVEVTAELPGVAEEDVDVTLTDDLLTIKGEKKSETEDTQKNYHVVERSYGAFQRSIRLPFEVDPKQVEARFEKGVLKVVLPKPPEVEAKSQKIEIKPGG